jgi:hypothetical protein
VRNAIVYHKPRRVWVEDGHVFAEGNDGAILQMEPEVAIDLGRLLEAAGTESFINKVIDKSETSSGSPIMQP